jgi:hypothetical protein
MLLSHALKTANRVPQIQYVGSVTKTGFSSTSWDTSGEALDVLSVATTGDLVVIAFSFSNSSDNSWSWAGMSFTAALNQTGSEGPGAYVGYRFIQAGDANPYVTGVSGWEGLSVVASVFRNVNSFVSTSATASSSGLPNPPSLTASGKLWVITGHLKDVDITNWAAPSDYILTTYATRGGSSSEKSSTVIAYRIENLSSDDPAAFTGSGSDNWRATTSAFA